VVLWGVHDDCGVTFVCGEDGYIGNFLEVRNGLGLLEGDVGWGDFGVRRMWATMERRSAATAVSGPMAMMADSVAVMISTMEGCKGVGQKARPLLR
jgi:hypothetical protein